jgi:crossover junction endodeoxyribonuclease RuvC
MTAVIGIDPGLSGAIALLRSNGELLLEDMPILDVAKKVIDEHQLASILDRLGSVEPGTVVYLERVGVRPGEGPVGAFTFGRGYGLIRGVCIANFLRIEDVTPAAWKKAQGVKGEKDVSRERASQLLPRHAHLWPRKKDHGRAEAALIAVHGTQQERTREHLLAA